MRTPDGPKAATAGDSPGLVRDIAVVIPTKDRPRPLLAAVQAVLEQTALPRELLIIDQSRSSDSRQAVERLFSRRPLGSAPALVHVHDPAIDGAATARNEGLRRTSARLVVFADDDGVPEVDALRTLADALREHPHLVAVGAVITSYEPPSRITQWFHRVFFRGPLWDERQPVYWNWSHYAKGEVVQTGKLNGGLMMCKREALEAVGGFDPRYRGASVGEDIELSQRLDRFASGGLALVGGAWLRHDSLGEWRDASRYLEFDLVAHHYRFAKNVEKTLQNVVRFSWMLAGMFIYAAGSALRQRRWGPLRSVLAGVSCVRSRYANCPFLSPIGDEEANISSPLPNPAAPAPRPPGDGI